ncbi:MAG TPA: META domain-containing protein [Acidimicrobiia bacterium]|nr:META domain-containing protein [Acidimicrobiia bacterium]
MNWRTPILAIALLTFAAACGDPGGAPVGGDDSTTTLPATTTMPERIPNGDWILASGVPIVDGYPITFSVDGDAFSGAAACNRYGGTITLSGDALVLSDIFQTEMACTDAGVMESESAFLAALGAVTSWSIVDGQLRLDGPGEPLVFDPSTEEPSEAFEGTTWILVSGSPIVDGYPITFSVDGDTFGGTSACNVYGGAITRSDDSIVLSEIFQTKMACMDTGVMEAESAYLTALAAATHWSIVDGQLQLETTGEPLVFGPSSEVPADALDGTAWILVSGSPIVDGYPITFSVEGEGFGGTAACNVYGGTIVRSDDSIALTEIFQTLMACMDNGVMEAESAFIAALGTVTDWSIVDGQLHLKGSGEPLVFDAVPEVPTEALVDTTWILDTVIQGDAASTPLGDEVTLVLAADGTVTGSTGCRTFSGTWVERNAQVVFTELTMEGDCSADLAGQDSLVVNVLGDGFTAEIDGPTLTITSMGNEGLIYIAESS